MISDALMESPGRAAVLAVAFAACLGGAGGCGNYSNEDLEYMNALPHREDLNADLKPSQLASAEEEAELSRFTHDTTRDFNGVLDFLRHVEIIRSYPPTSRGPNSRTWGPAPAEQVGWQWRFVMTRAFEDPDQFAYGFELQRIGDASDDWAPFVSGSFRAAAGAGVRRGEGEFLIQTGPLRDRGFPFGPDASWDSINVLYDTAAYPIRVEMRIEAPNASADYEYEAQASGQGAMRFRLRGDVVETPVFQEDELTITSRWLPSGAGRADAVVTLGDALGATRIQCWDESFRQTFNRTDWKPEDDFGDIADCPAIPAL